MKIPLALCIVRHGVAITFLKTVVAVVEGHERGCTVTQHIVRDGVVLREARIVMQDVRQVRVLGPRATFIIWHSFQEVVRVMAWFCLARSAMCEVDWLVASRVDEVVREFVPPSTSEVENGMQVGESIVVNKERRDLIVQIDSVSCEPPIRED